MLILKYRLKANENRPAIEIVKNHSDIPDIDCFSGQRNQVFMNILANAIDMVDEMAQHTIFEALKETPQRITIQTEKNPEQKAIELHISDNGKGMPDEFKARIFDHLFITKEVGKGTGLGLAITHQIVTQKHNGILEVFYLGEHGTTFHISLPLIR